MALACSPQASLLCSPQIFPTLCERRYVGLTLHQHIVCMWLWMRSHKWVSNVWEEWLALFALYYFFFHDSRLHVLAEPRETRRLRQSKQRQWESEYAWVHARSFCCFASKHVCQGFLLFCVLSTDVWDGYMGFFLWQFGQTLGTLLYRKQLREPEKPHTTFRKKIFFV